MHTIEGNERLGEILLALDNAAPSSILVTSSSLTNLLNRFLTGEITASDMEMLADRMEMNEAVVLDERQRPTLINCLFILSSPDINGELSPLVARDIICQLAMSTRQN